MTTLARFNSTSNRHNCPKYRYSTQGRVQYQTIVRLAIQPQILAEYQVFLIARCGRVIRRILLALGYKTLFVKSTCLPDTI